MCNIGITFCLNSFHFLRSGDWQLKFRIKLHCRNKRNDKDSDAALHFLIQLLQIGTQVNIIR